MLPILMAQVGEPSVIYKISGKDSVRQHLAELGFVVGEEVVVLSKLGESMIISVKEGRVAIDKGLASRILVNS